jgi:hypothetical protein
MCFPMVRYGYHLCSVDGRTSIDSPPIQVLSIFTVFPPLILVAKLFYLHRWDLLHFLRRLPRSFLAEAIFLLTGIVIAPDHPIRDNHLPFYIASYPEKPTLGKSHDRTIIGFRFAHRSSQLPGLGYVVLQRGDGDGDEDIRSRACGLV